MRTRQTTEQAQVVRDTSWLKSLLNNVPLLKWVRKFSADYMLDDNSMAKRFGIRTNEDSISVADTTMTKLLTTHCRFEGKEYTRFNMKQLAEMVALLGSEGELIITEGNSREMVVQIGDTCVVVCPLPKSDSRENEEE